MRRRYDAVVVGSGYGGGVAAARLAQHGRHVCVIERGREFQPGQFPDKFKAIRREVQVTGPSRSFGRSDGLFEFHIGEDINVFVGCGLGGGSLINAGVALRPDARVFSDGRWPGKISECSLLEEGFRRARHMLQPTANPQARQLIKYQALETACRSLGAAPHAAEVTVNFHDTVNAAGVEQPACTNCGDCLTGCNVGAKVSVAATYLPLAKGHGAEIFTGARVSHVVREEGGGWRVWYAPVDERGVENKLRSVSAEVVILAAGTLGSTGILLRSREQGLALSDRLGEGFSTNGDIVGFGYGADIRVNAIGVGHPAKADTDTVGNCVSGQVQLNGDGPVDESLYLQEGVVPSGVSSLLSLALLPKGKVLTAAQSLFQGVYGGPFSRFHSFFAVGHDTASGRLILNNGRLAVVWPEVGSQPVYGRVEAVMREATAATGAVYVKNPIDTPMMRGKPLTAHPLGGCGMGDDHSCGAVNHACQVFDAAAAAGETAVHAGLYVCDGAVMSGSIGVNPLLTITALAERAMLLMARRHGWRDDNRALLFESPPAE